MSQKTDSSKSASGLMVAAVVLAAIGLGVLLFSIRNLFDGEDAPLRDPLESPEYQVVANDIHELKKRFQGYITNDEWRSKKSDERMREYRWLDNSLRELESSTKEAVKKLATPVSSQINEVQTPSIIGLCVVLLGTIATLVLNWRDKAKNLEVQQLKGALNDARRDEAERDELRRKIAALEEQVRRDSPPEKAAAPAT